MSNRNLVTLGQEAHFLKSSRRSLGADLMAGTAAELEKLSQGRTTDFAELEKCVARLETAALLVEAELRSQHQMRAHRRVALRCSVVRSQYAPILMYAHRKAGFL